MATNVFNIGAFEGPTYSLGTLNGQDGWAGGNPANFTVIADPTGGGNGQVVEMTSGISTGFSKSLIGSPVGFGDWDVTAKVYIALGGKVEVGLEKGEVRSVTIEDQNGTDVLVTFEDGFTKVVLGAVASAWVTVRQVFDYRNSDIKCYVDTVLENTAKLDDVLRSGADNVQVTAYGAAITYMADVSVDYLSIPFATSINQSPNPTAEGFEDLLFSYLFGDSNGQSEAGSQIRWRHTPSPIDKALELRDIGPSVFTGMDNPNRQSAGFNINTATSTPEDWDYRLKFSIPSSSEGFITGPLVVVIWVVDSGGYLFQLMLEYDGTTLSVYTTDYSTGTFVTTLALDTVHDIYILPTWDGASSTATLDINGTLYSPAWPVEGPDGGLTHAFLFDARPHDLGDGYQELGGYGGVIEFSQITVRKITGGPTSILTEDFQGLNVGSIQGQNVAVGPEIWTYLGNINNFGDDVGHVVPLGGGNVVPALNNLLTVPAASTVEGFYRAEVIPKNSETTSGRPYVSPFPTEVISLTNPPPTADPAFINPLVPFVVDDLFADYTYYDPNSDPESGSEIRWESIAAPSGNRYLQLKAYGTTPENEGWEAVMREVGGPVNLKTIRYTFDFTIPVGLPTDASVWMILVNGTGYEIPVRYYWDGANVKVDVYSGGYSTVVGSVSTTAGVQHNLVITISWNNPNFSGSIEVDAGGPVVIASTAANAAGGPAAQSIILVAGYLLANGFGEMLLDNIDIQDITGAPVVIFSEGFSGLETGDLISQDSWTSSGDPTVASPRVVSAGGEAVEESTYDDLTIVPNAATSIGEVWRYRVHPNDGTIFGQWVTSTEARIIEVQPIALNPFITPFIPADEDDLTANYTYSHPTDPESGSEIRWHKAIYDRGMVIRRRGSLADAAILDMGGGLTTNTIQYRLRVRSPSFSTAGNTKVILTNGDGTFAKIMFFTTDGLGGNVTVGLFGAIPGSILPDTWYTMILTVDWATRLPTVFSFDDGINPVIEPDKSAWDDTPLGGGPIDLTRRSFTFTGDDTPGGYVEFLADDFVFDDLTAISNLYTQDFSTISEGPLNNRAGWFTPVDPVTSMPLVRDNIVTDTIVTSLNDLLVVPDVETSIGEQWFFTVKPNNGSIFGAIVQSPPVTIGLGGLSTVYDAIVGVPYEIMVQTVGKQHPYTFEWTVVTSPNGRDPEIDDSTKQRTSVTFRQPGDFTMRCKVIGAGVAAKFVEIPIRVAPSVSVSGTVFGDSNGGVADTYVPVASEVESGEYTPAYLWEIIEEPIPGAGFLDSPLSPLTALITNVVGDYTLRLIVVSNAKVNTAFFKIKVT
ncbi:hypothetical protein LCGC14_0147640 [marine sediment metagenome]|uniref:Uncharacterized protein n=1 Tax=marine sediment metagenome TaxID=412755 RepID=A0A0F9VFR8_9ZZZZ